MTGRGRGPRALAATVADITRPLFSRRGFADGAIVNEWPAIVGAHFAAHSAPEKIVAASGGGAEGTLHVRIDSGSLAIELQHLEPLLIERINGYFGYRAVARLKLLQGPLPKRRKASPPAVRPLEPGEEEELVRHLCTVDDPELRQALESLGRAVIGRRAGKD
jgi:hypothetical protein